MKTGYIYKYTFPNGKVYIGQTRVSVQQRHWEHMSASRDHKRSTICERAIAKYGEPQLDIIETIAVQDDEVTKLIKELNDAEKKWIKEYDSTNTTKGYNIQNGGKVITPEEFILQEKWYEIYEKDKWGYLISYYKELLKSIGYKICITGEKLNKEEKFCWYGYKFMDNWHMTETTFNAFYKRYLDYYCDIGDIPYEFLEILNNETASLEEKANVEKEVKLIHYNQIIDAAIHEHWIEDIRKTIWRQIMKKRDKIIKEWYISKK